MSVGDFFQVTLFQTMQGQEMLNVFHYLQTAGSADAAGDLLAAFQGTPLEQMSDIQTDQVTYDRVLVQNLIDITDNAEDLTPTPAAGQVLTAPAPLRLALSYRSTRPDLSKRYSYKRIGGVAQAFLSGPVWNTLDVEVIGVGTAFEGILASGGNFFSPCQLHAEYPGGGAPAVWSLNYVITNYVAQAQPSTQNSRAFGRGI